MNTGTVILIVLAAVILSVSIACIVVYHRMHAKVKYMLDAMEDGEMNFRFEEQNRSFKRYHRTLNRIRNIFEKEQIRIRENEEFYGRMLDQVKTGIVVIDQSPKREGQVIYSNAASLNKLGVSALSQIRQLKNVSEELEDAFRRITSKDNEIRCSFYNERGKTEISLTAAETSIQGRPVKIVVLNDITGEIAHNEELSWNKLIRVLTHEIMNTVTPIASLSHTLSEELSESGNSSELNREELKTGLDTISESSKGLIRFVDRYRTLTRVSPPVKKAFYVRELVELVEKLTREQLLETQTKFTYVEKSEDILLYADQDQILQILVNLVKNAAQAEASAIEISAEIDHAESVVIQVSNNGRPISKEKREEIFVPFYTTKPSGSGIGLSLSRQIMRLHNGTITLTRSDERITSFALYFK